MKIAGPAAALVLAVLAMPLPATAQSPRDEFLSALVQFYGSLHGAYGDEGPLLTLQLDRMASALAAWDREIGGAERQLRPRLQDADARTAMEIHTILASLYLERGRFEDALREFDADIRIDPARAAFHRYTALIHQSTGRTADAADAFRTAWLHEPTDAQNAYRLVAERSSRTTEEETAQAIATLSDVESELIRGERPRAESPFRTTRAIDDDAGGAIGFIPPLYTRGFELLQHGAYDAGLMELRGAVAADPVVADATSRTRPMAEGIAALRQGLVDSAIERLEAAVAGAGDSAEARRILATAYGVSGDLEASLQQLREAVRLNARDERGWIALARTVEDAGTPEELIAVLQAAVAALPDSGALRWRLLSARRQRLHDADLELIASAERLVLFAGKGELLAQMAAIARSHLDYDRAADLLARRVALTPNNAAAHRALGQAYVEQGRDQLGYAELVMALLLDPSDAQTLTALGQLHLSANRAAQAVAALERALALETGDSQAMHALGNALLRVGRASEGRVRLEESARRQAQDVEDQRSRRTAAMLSVQAEIHASKGELDAAIDAWTRALTIRRDSVGALRVASVLMAAGRLEEAAAVLRAAIPLNPRAEIHRRLAEVYAALGRTEDSLQQHRMYTEQRLEQLRRGL